MNYEIKIAGDSSILIAFENDITDETNRKVRKLAFLIDSKKIWGVEEVILGFSSLVINYHPMKISYQEIHEKVSNLTKEINLFEEEEHRLIEIPVLYGGEAGPDLHEVARLNNLSEEEVIQIHTKPIYTVYFLGFTPGFPFLGGLSEKIATPRLANPRKRIKAGSVGIANNQTGIYPVNSPGGWRLIGHTPTSLCHPKREHPFLLSPGDKIKFIAITIEEYEQLVQGGDSNV